MKNYLLSFALILVVANSFAQKVKDKPLSINIGAELATPINYLKDRNGFGLGASILAEYKLSKKFSGTLDAGFINYFGQTNGFKYPSVTQIPILVGARYYIVKDFFISGELGASHFTDAGLGFTYSPGIGVKFGKFDISLKYSNTKYDNANFSNFSLRIGFKL